MSNKTVNTDIDFTGQISKTQKHMAAETDINNIVRRMANGQLPEGNSGTPQFRDLTHDMSYHDMLNHVSAVQSEFAGLHHTIRTRFKNDPENLIQWLNDPKNTEEAVGMGLMEKMPEKAPEPPPVVPPEVEPK